MVGWLIVLGILALLLGLLLSPFSFAWDYDAPKDRFFWKLSWLGISFADSARKRSGRSRKSPADRQKRNRRNLRKRAKSKSWNTAGLSSRAACPCFRSRCGCCGKASL